MREYEEQVKKGIEYLDNNHEGWREKINLSELDLGNPHKCILGQLYGSYGIALRQGFTAIRYSHGYSLEIMYAQKYEKLTKEWKVQMTATPSKPLSSIRISYKEFVDRFGRESLDKIKIDFIVLNKENAKSLHMHEEEFAARLKCST